MPLYSILFYAVAALILVSTGLAVTRQNLVHAVIYLIMSFFGSAFLFYLFGAPFLAAIMVIIYAGAIMVLFLFIVMMLRLEEHRARVFAPRQIVPAALLTGAYLIVGGLMLVQDPSVAAPLASAQATPSVFGAYVFQKTWLAVEITSLILLVALIGALLIGKPLPEPPKE